MDAHRLDSLHNQGHQMKIVYKALVSLVLTATLDEDVGVIVG